MCINNLLFEVNRLHEEYTTNKMYSHDRLSPKLLTI